MSKRLGGFAFIVLGLAWIAWFYLEMAPVRLGFDDTDSPAVSLAFLRAHPTAYAQTGAAVIVLAIALVLAVHALAARFAASSPGLGARASTTFGLMSAAFFLGHAATRMSTGPILHIDSLDHDWGEAAYVAVQMTGTQLMGAAALLTFSLWAATVALIGWRSRALPGWLCVLAVFPAIRILEILGPLTIGGGGVDVEWVWLAFMASIAMTPIWMLLMGVWLLRAPRIDG